MLFLKIALQIVGVLSTWVVARLDYSWRDKRTTKFKKGLLGLHIILPILLAINIAVTIIDDQEKKREIAEGNKKIEDLNSKLSDVTNELTGGDSFCYFSHSTHMYMSPNEPPSYNDVELWLNHSGKYPLRGIDIRLVDVQKVNHLFSERSKSPVTFNKLSALVDESIEFQNLLPEQAALFMKLELPANVNTYHFNVTFDARNGRWKQRLRFIRAKDGHWGLASQTRRGDQVIHEHGSSLLPKDNSGKPKWD